MDCEKPIHPLSNQQLAQASFIRVLSRFLSEQEAAQIIKQFQSKDWRPNGQVLWSGILREKAQKWADRHRLQTLTTAMGPLMDEEHPQCLKSKKNHRQWSRYVHGASAIFAWRIAQGEKVTLLSPPPPERFHPSGLSYYQLIEEPIIRGLFNQKSVHKIIIAHPMVEESEDEEFSYELWPNDRSEEWVKRFGSKPHKINWRQVGHSNDITELRSLMTSSEWHVFSPDQFKHFEKRKVGLTKPKYGILLLCLFLLLQDKISIFILFALLYLLFGNIGEENTAEMGEKIIVEAAESTSTVISPKKINTEQNAAKSPRDEIKAKRKALNKANQEAIKKAKGEAKAKTKSLNKAEKKAARKLKDEAKAKIKSLNKSEKSRQKGKPSRKYSKRPRKGSGMKRQQKEKRSTIRSRRLQ